MKRLYLSCLLGICYLVSYSQDIHYSQFFNSPLNLNPALTGVFAGEQRLSGNYKSQWASVPVDYNTFTLEYDRNFAASDTSNFFSLGGIINYDQAGAVSLNLVNLSLNASYSLRLSDHSYLTPGVQVGLHSRSYDRDKVTTGNQWNGEFQDPSIPAEALVNDGIRFFDVSAGLNYHRQTSYRDFFDLGVGLFHITTPDQSFSGGATESNLSQRLSLYGLSSFEVADKLDVLLNATFQNQGEYQEILVNAQGKIYLDKDNTALFLGLGYRVGDAWYPMIALQYNNIYVGFNYDVNFSGFSEKTSNKGGPEFSFRYMIYNVPNAPFKPCPIY